MSFQRIVPHGLGGVFRLLVSWFFLATIFACPVAANFDSTGWKRYRQILIPEHVTKGPIAVALDSEVLEHCRSDLGDLRVVSGAGSIVNTTPAGELRSSESETFPVRTYRVIEKPGKFTEIVVDKTAKVVSRGILIKTASTDFVRTVEVRGSHSNGESYVVRMDGLIADMKSPLPVRHLSVFYPLNNFRYLYVRILSENLPLLKIDGIECFPPQLDDPLSKTTSTRIMENRADQSSGVSFTVVDLGEHRLLPTSLSIATRTPSFIKKAIIYGGTSGTNGEWEKIREEVMFRISRNDTMTERLTASMNAGPVRFLKLELSGGSRGAVKVDTLRVAGTTRLVAFNIQSGETYKLYYDNPEAKASAPGAVSSELDLQSAAGISSEIRLGPENKNLVPAKPRPVTKTVEVTSSSNFGKWLGIAMLLMGLLLLFSLMLKALSARGTSRRRKPPTINSRI